MIFKCSNQEFKIGNTVLCKSVSIEISKGECYQITGPNGIGKTVLSKALLGLNNSLENVSCRNIDSKSLVYIPDTPFFLDNDLIKTTLLTLRYFYSLSTQKIRECCRDLNLILNVNSADKVSSLSFGTLKKIMLIPLFVDAILYVLDEIFTGLDSSTQEIVINRLVQIYERGATIIIIEHNGSITDQLKKSIKIKEIVCNSEKISI